MRRIVVALLTFSVISAACTTDQPEQTQRSQITILAPDGPAGLDYEGEGIPVLESMTAIINLVDPLIDYAPGGENEEGIALLNFDDYEGRLAESWEFDEQSLTWTFHLRQDVVGCEGQTFNADDVIYTFARAKAASGTIPVGWFFGNVAGIDTFDERVFEGDTELGDEVQKIDDFTVTIRQSDPPSQLFLKAMTIFGLGILDKETMEENATEDDPWSHEYNNNENAPGFGAYCLERWDKGSEFVVRANPDYYRGPPPFERIVFREVPQSSNRVAALRSGAAQLVERLTPREYDSLRSAEGIRVAGVIGNENLFVHMNWNNQPFDDPLVRQAIAHAIPYDDIISTGYLGQATKWGGHIPEIYPGFHRSDIQYEEDPGEAARLLAEAGYPDGEGLDGFPSETFELTYVAEKESVLGPIATIVQNSLRELGLPVELNPIPQAQFADRLFAKKDLPFALDDQEKPDIVDAGYGITNAHISEGSPANNTNYSNPRIDEIAVLSRTETDPEVRQQLLAEGQDILQRDLNWIPVIQFKTQWAFSDDITGIVWHAENSLRWFDLRPVDEAAGT
jgi:peptide/nickel transport system substrate-binding protein